MSDGAMGLDGLRRGWSWWRHRAGDAPLRIALLAALALGSARAAVASAWNIPQGQGLLIADYTFSGGSRYFNGAGHLSPAATYLKQDGFLYLEYGVTDWLMAVVKPDVVAASIATPDPFLPRQAQSAHYRGLGTSDVGAQLHLLAFGPAVIATQATFRLPATSARSNPALVGNTSLDFDARILAGLTFSIANCPAFMEIEGAYRERSAEAPSQWHLDTTLGVRPWPRFLLLLQSETVLPSGRGSAWFPASRYTKLGASLVYDLSARWSVEFGAFQTIAGVNALRERGFHEAIWYRF